MAKARGDLQQVDLIGRESELGQLKACIQAGRNVLLEGPVGVGKTHLAVAATLELKRPVHRIDGDSRYTEQKLSGWFDPPAVIKKGYSAASFIPGPLVEAMKDGGVLFINELNRLPEGVQNILLPAIDERMVTVPRLGQIRAKDGFCVVATQNPKEFVATSHLSEAILDRFELVVVDYQSEADEIEIVVNRLREQSASPAAKKSERYLAMAAVRLARITRDHPRVRRGASVRAALAVGEIAQVFLSQGKDFQDAFLTAALLALPTRVEIEREQDGQNSLHAETASLVREWVSDVLDSLDQGQSLKKKT